MMNARTGIAILAIFLSASTNGFRLSAQQTDPTLTAAVIAQTEEMKSIHKTRKKT